MVKTITKNQKIYYHCEECKHFYETEELAQECENWCQKYKSCNLEIIKKAVIFNEKDQKLNFTSILTGIFVGGLIGGLLFFLPLNKSQNNQLKENNQQNYQSLIEEIRKQALPDQGFKTRLALGDVVSKMIDCGVIDLEKLKKLYNNQIPEYWQKAIQGSNEPIVVNFETANYLLNIFWPLGLSNKTKFNKNIPFNEKELPYLASTGGWWLGKAENGAEYFNKCEIIKLTPEQEKLVYEVAQNTYRPCCNNSTFAQDCNHGSALLGALELAASQNYNREELYKLALELNSFWFPQNYLETAIYFKVFENKNWHDVDPKKVMSAEYSSISGWLANINQKVAKLNLPQIQTGSGCGL